jgi:hypothetical protein
MEEVRKLQLMDLGTKSGQDSGVEMMEISLPDSFLDKAQRCSVMLRELGMHVAIEDSALRADLYRRASNGGFEQFEEDWPSCCDVLIFPDGAIEIEMEARSGMTTLVCSLGKVRDLQMGCDQESDPRISTPRMR